MSINKVAEIAGVSSSTVSRVINNHPRVAPETAEAVRNAMRRIGYTPSDRRPGPKPAAQRPKTTTNVAFLVLGSTHARPTPAFEELLRGVSQAASEKKLNLLFSHVINPTQMPSHLAEERLDGLLLHGLPPEKTLSARLERLPTVWLMGNRQRPGWGDQVMPDTYEIGSLAARHLVAQGHRRLAFCNLDHDHWPFALCQQSFRIVAGELGASVDVIERSTPAGPDPWHRYPLPAVNELVDQFLALPDRPTGIFVADDMQVALIQPALIQRGVKIGPGETEIVSCNNERPFLVGLHPQPTEIDIRVESIGRRAVDQLIWRMAHTNVPERMITCVEPSLAPHQSHNGSI